MQMRINADVVLELTPAEYYEMVRESEAQDAKKSVGHRNVLASPTEAVQATVEHQKPKAGDLIEITGDGQVGRMKSHGFPVGTILKVRDYDAPEDRVYASRLQDTFGMMIHNSYYKVVTRNVVEPLHEFGVGDIVRVTSDHSRGSRNKTGDIAEITELSDRGSYHVHVVARKDVTQGRHCTSGSYHKEDSLELVVAKKDRKDSAVQK